MCGDALWQCPKMARTLAALKGMDITIRPDGRMSLTRPDGYVSGRVFFPAPQRFASVWQCFHPYVAIRGGVQ